MMKMKVKPRLFVSIILALFTGLTFGVALQKYYDVGNIVDALGMKRRPIFAPIPTVTIEDDIPEEFQGRLSLFILAGQSNMAGRGEIPKSGQNANSRVFVFGNDYHWRIAVEPIDDPSNQVDKVSEDPDAGFSPALAFATSLLVQRSDMVIGLIPCARGGKFHLRVAKEFKREYPVWVLPKASACSINNGQRGGHPVLSRGSGCYCPRAIPRNGASSKRMG